MPAAKSEATWLDITVCASSGDEVATLGYEGFMLVV